MKRLLVTTNVLFLLIILSMAFQRKDAPDTRPTFQTCTDCTEDDFHGLSSEELMDGVSRYGTTHADIIDRQRYPLEHNIKDARACWFAVDTLKKFICIIEKYSRKLKIPAKDLGIRFYYAVYPDSSAKHLWNRKYASQHTLFMVPTYNDKKKNFDIDFDPRFSCDEKARLHLGPDDPYTIRDIAELCRRKPGQNGLTIITAPDQLSSQNQGQMCPPTCPLSTTALLEAADSLHIGYDN